jgi:hypothetical protein
MEELRKALGLQYSVQENVDYAIGTSSSRRLLLHAALG